MSITKYFNGKCVIAAMEEVREICSAANAVRSKNFIRTRLPLNNLDIVSPENKYSYLALAPDLVQIIKDECNVKQVTLISDEMVVTL